MSDIASVYKSTLDEIRSFWEFMPDKPDEDPEGILRTLWLTASGKPTAPQNVKNIPLPELDANSLKLLHEFIEKKRRGTPLAHICQRSYFLGLEYITGPEALIPRKETEILGNEVLKKLKQLSNNRKNIRVIDVCTGSGNLALSYAFYNPDIHVYCSDLSEQAISLAKINSIHLGVQNRVDFFVGDLFTPFRNDLFLNKCDLISCNPPYISSSKVSKMHKEISNHEPELAFNGGVFGISILSRLLKESVEFLKPESWLCFEVGVGQGPGILKIIQKQKSFSKIETFEDSAGIIRAIFIKTDSI